MVRNRMSRGTGRGLYFDEQEGKKILSAWAAGEFRESDYLMAEQWHADIEKIDLTRLQDLGSKLKSLKAKTLEEIPTIVEKLVKDPEYQFEILQFLVKLANVPEEISTTIFNRWRNDCGMPPIQDFSQYGYYCIRVHLIFQWALFSGLVGPRSTHYIDIHYLFELPFCRIFSSNDKFHVKFASLLKTHRAKIHKRFGPKSRSQANPGICELSQ